MLRATAYIMACSAKNRLRRRLQRLREPRYLLGALVGSAYLYFSVFGRMRAGRPGRAASRLVPSALLPLLDGSGPIFAGLALLAVAGASLIVPFGSRLLEFSRTESEFLFPSPVSRRQLLLYRLVRSQWAVFFSALVISLTYPFATPGARVRGFIGAWLALMICHVFFAGVSLTRARPATPTARSRAFTWAPRVALATALATILIGAQRTMRAEGFTLDSAGDVMNLLTATCASGLPRLALWPFTAVAAPLFAESFTAFVLALPGALLMYGLTIGWVLSADGAFEAMTDALVDARQQTATPSAVYKARRMVWTLSLEGWPETPFVWKTANQAVRIVSRRLLLRIVLILGWITLVLVLFAGRARGVTQVAGIFAAVGSAFTVVFGPQILRLDLRQDLQHLELLKTWPVRAAAVVRGQMIGPAMAVTAIAWLLGAIALVLSAAAFTRTGAALRLAAGWAALIAMPALILAQYTVHNAAALFFPAWIARGGSRPRGVDAIGQRLILLGGTWIVLAVAVAPGVLVGGVLWLAFARFLGPWILIPASAIAATIVLLEVGMATEALGPVYERLDITAIERNDT